jgi:hypothetical protein
MRRKEKKSMEIVFKIVMTILGCIVFLFFLRGVWKGQIDIKETCSMIVRKVITEPDFIARRDPNKIYQNGKEVGIVSKNVQEKNDTIIFEQLCETENLDRDVPFEYQRHKLKIIRIESIAGLKISASNTETNAKKAVLTNVVCEKID